MRRNLDMNPEIRAVLFGLVAAALAGAVILSLFYRPFGLVAAALAGAVVLSPFYRS
jgi:hypothetical protein